jgi:nucleotide-binding universal stress UspA family protein
MEKKMRVLIGYDGSSVGERVVEDLKRAGLPHQVSATVLSAADFFLPAAPDDKTPAQFRAIIEKSRQRAQDGLRIAQSLSEHGAQEVKKAFPDWDVIPEAPLESPAWALVNRADGWKADLIVVGAHGHSPAGRFIGSVSQLVLVHACQSVRIARPRPNPSSARLKILIGVDGSKGAQTAIDAVLKRTWNMPIDVSLISVIEPKMSAVLRHLVPPEIRWIWDQDNDERTTLGRMLEKYAEDLRKAGAVVTCRVETGDPKAVLLKHAETWHADSIFLGARGLSNLKRFLIGGGINHRGGSGPLLC